MNRDDLADAAVGDVGDEPFVPAASKLTLSSMISSRGSTQHFLGASIGGGLGDHRWLLLARLIPLSVDVDDGHAGSSSSWRMGNRRAHAAIGWRGGLLVRCGTHAAQRRPAERGRGLAAWPSRRGPGHPDGHVSPGQIAAGWFTRAARGAAPSHRGGMGGARVRPPTPAGARRTRQPGIQSSAWRARWWVRVESGPPWSHRDALSAAVEPWMLDTAAWPGSIDDYGALVWLVGELLTDPKHACRPQ